MNFFNYKFTFWRNFTFKMAVDWEIQTSPSFNQGRLGKWKFFWNSSVFFLSVQSLRSHFEKSFGSAPSGRLTSYIVSFQSAPAYSSKSRAPPKNEKKIVILICKNKANSGTYLQGLEFSSNQSLWPFYRIIKINENSECRSKVRISVCSVFIELDRVRQAFLR